MLIKNMVLVLSIPNIPPKLPRQLCLEWRTQYCTLLLYHSEEMKYKPRVVIELTTVTCTVKLDIVPLYLD